MAETRFTNIIIGLETLYGKSVMVYNKGGKGYSRFARQVIPFLYQNDIITQQNILICHPYETLEDVEMAVKEIIYYKEFLEDHDIPFTSSPVGTVVLNYPSASYFKVLKDPDFEIVYHCIPQKIRKQVPTEIRETFEKIPYKAVRKNCSGEEKINKIDYCAKIYSLWSNDNERMLQLKVSALAKHKEIILDKWQKNQIAVRCLKEKDLEKKAVQSLLQPILSPLMDKKGEQVLISSLLQCSDQDTKQIIVPALLSLCMMGIADLVRGKKG